MLKTDDLLLSYVFGEFRNICIEYYPLDLHHYFSSPGLSWGTILKMIDVRLDLITDIDLYQFIEKGIRGGVSYLAQR